MRSDLLVLAAALVVGQPPAIEPDPIFRSELLNSVADDAPLPAAWLNREEVLAYDKLVLHAREMPADLLHRAARHDLTFAALYGPERAKYRGQLVHVEGRLRLLRRLDLPATLEGMSEGLNALYEAWIVDRTSDAYYCVVVSELPPGLKPSEEIDQPVEGDAYFFKRYRYETRERLPGGVNEQRLAPLLIGHTIRPKAVHSAGSSLWAVPSAVLLGTVGIVGLGLAAGVAVVWWFRREDRRVRERLQQARATAFAPESTADDGAEVRKLPPEGEWEPFGTSPSEN